MQESEQEGQQREVDSATVVQADVNIEADGTGSPLVVKRVAVKNSSCAQQRNTFNSRDYNAIRPLDDEMESSMPPTKKQRKLDKILTTGPPASGNSSPDGH